MKMKILLLRVSQNDDWINELKVPIKEVDCFVFSFKGYDDSEVCECIRFCETPKHWVAFIESDIDFWKIEETITVVKENIPFWLFRDMVLSYYLWFQKTYGACEEETKEQLELDNKKLFTQVIHSVFDNEGAETYYLKLCQYPQKL